MGFPATAVWAAVMALWMIALTAGVVQRRRKAQVSLGDGGNDELRRWIRAHGNAAETVPIALVLMALAEAGGAPAGVIHAAGAMLASGRLLHGLHFMLPEGGTRLRVAGMALTLTVTGLMALGLLGHGLIGSVG